jgi:hypothetical protein
MLLEFPVSYVDTVSSFIRGYCTCVLPSVAHRRGLPYFIEGFQSPDESQSHRRHTDYSNDNTVQYEIPYFNNNDGGLQNSILGFLADLRQFIEPLLSYELLYCHRFLQKILL